MHWSKQRDVYLTCWASRRGAAREQWAFLCEPESVAKRLAAFGEPGPNQSPDRRRLPGPRSDNRR